MQDEHSVVCESNDAQVCHSNEKTVRVHTGASCMLEAWLALTIGLEVSKSIPFRGSYRWLALTMLRVTRAMGPFLESPDKFSGPKSHS